MKPVSCVPCYAMSAKLNIANPKKRNISDSDKGSNLEIKSISNTYSKLITSENIFSDRPSLLDVKQLATEHELSTNLTGFYHFYWITLTFFVISTFFVNWVDTGKLLSGKLMEICFRDAKGVILGELFFFIHVIAAGLSIFSHGALFKALSKLIPFSVLFLGCFFGFQRNWSGLQRAIYLLHSLSVFMKVYAFLYHHRTVKVPTCLFSKKLYHLIYFVFAPTMIYSEEYPKSKRYLTGEVCQFLNT